MQRAGTSFDPSELDAGQNYNLLTGLVVPRPIGWVGSAAGDGSHNLAPYSFFNAVAATPPVVLFAPSGQPAMRKDTLSNVEASGEFTLSVVTSELLEAMNQSAIDAPPELSEFEFAGLTAAMGDVVAAPYVAEAKAAMECRVTNIVDAGSGPMASRVVFGEVVRFHVADEIRDGFHIDQSALGAVGRLAGGGYSVADDVIEVPRPSWGDQS